MEAAVVEDKAEQVINGIAGNDGYVGDAGQLDALGRERYIVGPESGGSSTAKNPDSSAYGSVQFISGTYLEWVSKVNPEWAKGLSQTEILATRSDPVKEAEIYRAFRDNNVAILKSNGFADSPRNRYIMHHFGVGDGPRIHALDATGASVVRALRQGSPRRGARQLGRTCEAKTVCGVALDDAA